MVESVKQSPKQTTKACHDGTLKLTARHLKIETQGHIFLVGGFNPFEKY